ncbi:MAG: hypothetical protein HYW23_02150 [Candidatus Aenigmarchaeota archaeon]|nr:hypothetical protein [Candidatus Aenigmarchaeota archaeon]
MAPELDTSTVKERELSDLERQLFSETDVSSEKESIWQKAGDMARYVSDFYFKPKSFERSGKVYEALGVRKFKKIMFNGDYMNALLRKYNPNHKLIRNEGSAKSWEMFTRIYEGIHVGFGSLMLSGMVDRLANGDYDGAAIIAAINTVVNIYPIMLQRYNRARIYKVLDRKQ